MRVNVKRGFNRLFVVLTVAWFVYCLFWYPTQQPLDAQQAFERELRDCYGHKMGQGQEFKDCLVFAEVKSGINDWSLKAFYTRESRFLALIVIVVPIATYGVCRGLAALSQWVWHGFGSP